MLIPAPSPTETLPFCAIPPDARLQLPATFFVLVLEENVKAATDLGRDIPLFRYDALVLPQPGQHAVHPQADQQAFLRLIEQQFISNVKQHGRELVRLVEPLPACNCHGWIFTGGRFGVQDPHVPSILRENGYQAVENSADGDLVIYRRGDTIKHSGIVRRMPSSSEFVVESKWGPFGAFRHAPDAFPGVRTVYRSHRSGHLMATALIAK